MPERRRYRHRPMSGQPRGRHSAGPRRSLLRTVLTAGPTLLLQLAVVLALVAGTTAFVPARQDRDALDRRPRPPGPRLRPHGRVTCSTARASGYDQAHDLVSPTPDASLRRRRDHRGAVRPAGAAHRRRPDPHGVDHRRARSSEALMAARRPGRRRLRVGLAQPPINRGGIDARRPDAAPPHLPRGRRAARGDDDRHHGPQRARRGRRARCGTQDRVVHRPAAHRRTTSRSSP